MSPGVVHWQVKMVLHNCKAVIHIFACYPVAKNSVANNILVRSCVTRGIAPHAWRQHLLNCLVPVVEPPFPHLCHVELHCHLVSFPVQFLRWVLLFVLSRVVYVLLQSKSRISLEWSHLTFIKCAAGSAMNFQ